MEAQIIGAMKQVEAGKTDTSMGSLRVLRVLDHIIAERGAPQRIRSDNGPEFTSPGIPGLGMDQRIERVHIRPRHADVDDPVARQASRNCFTTEASSRKLNL
jgi:transposase InsO family protein